MIDMLVSTLCKCLLTHQQFSLSVEILSVCPNFLSVYVPISLSLGLSIYLLIYVSTYLPVHLSVGSCISTQLTSTDLCNAVYLRHMTCLCACVCAFGQVLCFKNHGHLGYVTVVIEISH